MPKFSESPFFILKDYLMHKDLDGENYYLPVYNQLPPSGSCSLRGSLTGVSVNGGYGTNLHIKTTNGYYRLKCLYVPSDNDLDSTKFYSRGDNDSSYDRTNETNKFTFELIPGASAFKGSEFTIDDLFVYGDDMNYSGSEVYILKDSPFYDYLVNNGFDDFININLPYIYFGKLYRGEGENRIDIYSDHFKDYVYRALPIHNRSENYDEFLGVSFDQLFQPVYNRLKMLQSMSDPYEVSDKYLKYLLEMYNMPSIGGLLDERIYINNIISLLKRKGTYVSLYIIFSLLTKTTNRLNVYERWHETLGASACPYPYFEDHLYTKNRLYDVALPTDGAGARYYKTTYPVNGTTYCGVNVPYPVYGSIDSDYPYDADTVYEGNGTSITINHNLDTVSGAIIQVLRSGLGNMWADQIVSITNDTPSASTVTFTQVKSAFLVAAEADYVHYQSTPSSAWTVSHALDEKYNVVDVLDSNMVHLAPSAYTVWAVDNNTSVVFMLNTVPTLGYALIGKADYVFSQSANPSAAWWIEHNQETDFNLVTLYQETEDALNDTSMWDFILDRYQWTNKMLLTLPLSSSGFLAMKAATGSTDRVHNINKTLSTHIKIEMDLSTEPLGPTTREDFIINKTTIDKLKLLWEKLRPVSRVYHYGMVIGPTTDFTGMLADLYATGPVRFVTRAMLEPNFIEPGCYVHYQPNLTKTINIFHGLSSENIITQCWSMSNEMIEPGQVMILSDNVVKVTFDKVFSGYITLSTALTTETNSIASSAWTSSESYPDKFDEILQVYDYGKTRILPDNIALTQTVSGNAIITFSQAVSGHMLGITAHRYDFTTPTNGTTHIMHNLDAEALQVQVHTDESDWIIPEKIKITTPDQIALTFDTTYAPVSGYVLIKKIAHIAFRNQYTFKFLKIGYGTSEGSYNPIESNSLEQPYSDVFTISDQDVDEDADYYYITVNINENLDFSVNGIDKYGIREIGIYESHDDILFYTYCGLIEKPIGTSLKLYYKIRKRI